MIGRQFENENRALAAECGGDIFVWMKMYDKAVEFYALGANVIRTLEKENFSATCSDADRRAIRSRIEYRLRFARMMLDEERFDPAWAAYRYTRTVHTVYNGYIDAFMLYARIMEEFPNTMYADAAENYMIEILLLLADRRNLPAMAERFEQKKSDLRAAQWELAMSKSSGELPAVQKWRQARVDELISQIQKWRTIPLGQMALQKAEEVTEKFVARDKFGLYRGEALLNVGLHHLTVGLDMDKAEEWLRRADVWFDEMRDMDKDLKGFTLPDSVRNLAMPPREERFKDQWENVRLSEPRPGDVFNRRTCKWYLNSKQKDCVLALGLIEFARGYTDEAGNHWDRLAELDKEFYAQQTASGWENATVHYRLMQRLKHQPGSLFATPEEMAAFVEPKLRLAVLIADWYYLSEAPEKAYHLYRAIQVGKYGELSRNGRAYIAFAVFSCLGWNKKLDEIAYIEPILKNFVDTPSERRVVLGYANRLDPTKDQTAIPKKLKVYEYLIRKYPESEEAEYAAFVLGILHVKMAQIAQRQRNADEMILHLRKTNDIYHYCIQANRAGPYKADMEQIVAAIKPYLGRVKN